MSLDTVTRHMGLFAAKNSKKGRTWYTRAIPIESEPVWTTITGEKIPVSKLTNDHLRNVIFFVQQSVGASGKRIPQEMWTALLTEADKRKLPWTPTAFAKAKSSDRAMLTQWLADIRDMNDTLRAGKGGPVMSVEFAMMELEEWISNKNFLTREQYANHANIIFQRYQSALDRYGEATPIAWGTAARGFLHYYN